MWWFDAFTVHPHACGENVGPIFIPYHQFGTPPRLWGKLCGAVLIHVAFRYTPTPVGKTHRCGLIRSQDRYTPTPVGKTFRYAQGLRHALRYTPTPVGKTVLKPLDSSMYGTPPRLWGKLFADACKRFCEPVHPHACGENGGGTSVHPHPVGMRIVYCGTPPRLWGKLLGQY